ncbi:MAG: sterol desaturase family protein [Solirubrobacterales bacterium]|nr:sterol desaturase family protein [Solirubrobacterales bacterium]HMT05477.1 sterol desaturase family protein [Solirubrobacterales bacterium]
MGDLIIYAIPFFFLAMGLEYLTLRHAAHDHEHGEGATSPAADPDAPVGFEKKDTATSLSMGLGHLFIAGAWKLVVLVIYAAIYSVSPIQLSPSDWWTWVLLFFVDDLAYYAFHRSHHRIRLFWAMHVVHHSSEHYNFSTALRQDWSPFSSIFFWMPGALLFEPWMIYLAFSWSLLYQFLLHTEAVGKLPRPIEFIFNTPSHHRVHHGSQEQYLDKNYAGILIIWDRMFGTFEPEEERVRYGLTKNIETFHPVKVAYGEYMNIWRDVKASDNWRDRIGYTFKGPGWKPTDSGRVAAETADQVGVDESDRLHQGVHVGRPDELESPPA